MKALMALIPSSLLASILSVGNEASAATVYSYTGDNFTALIDQTPPAGVYTTSMDVSGSFTVSAALPSNMPLQPISPLSFSFSDGRNTITNSSPLLDVLEFNAGTDPSGNINNWVISLAVNPSPTVGQQVLIIQTSINGPDAGVIGQCTAVTTGGACDAFVQDKGSTPIGDAGTWIAADATTPLPPALLLFTTGLGALGLIGWRRKRKAAAFA